MTSIDLAQFERAISPRRPFFSFFKRGGMWFFRMGRFGGSFYLQR